MGCDERNERLPLWVKLVRYADHNHLVHWTTVWLGVTKQQCLAQLVHSEVEEKYQVNADLMSQLPERGGTFHLAQDDSCSIAKLVELGVMVAKRSL